MKRGGVRAERGQGGDVIRNYGVNCTGRNAVS